MIKISKPLIAIVGQTASGKSDAAQEIAEKYNGEIIAADSRTVYKFMDIGTAKPSKADMKKIPHHLIDIIEPDQTYSASEFKKRANKLVDDISTAGKLPIVVGGTGLYVNSFLYDYDFGKPPVEKFRRDLQKLSLENLQEKVENLGLDAQQINFRNKRHLIRAIENGGIVRTAKPLRQNALFLGLKPGEETLKTRIYLRNERMIKIGLENEVRNLAEVYGWEAPGLNAVGYKEWRGYFKNEYDIDEVKQKMFKNNWQYARRQKIWFKRDNNIIWTSSVNELVRQVEQFLLQ